VLVLQHQFQVATDQMVATRCFPLLLHLGAVAVGILLPPVLLVVQVVVQVERRNQPVQEQRGKVLVGA
jgi:hypothetical protein